MKNAKFGAKTLQDFFGQFGQDVYTEILLEELFKGLIENEIVFIFGEQKQKGDQADHSVAKSESSELGVDGSETTGATNNLGEKDRPDYP